MARLTGSKNGVKTLVDCVCLHCGKTFRRPPTWAKTAKYCSRSCLGKANARKNGMDQAGPEHPRWDNGAYRNYALRHHGERCQRCGATDDLHVHHIDRDHSNNTLDNLMVLCESCHQTEHAHDRPINKISKTCPTCGHTFYAWPHEIDTNIYCSRECAHANPEYRQLISTRRKAYFDRLKSTPEGREELAQRIQKANEARLAKRQA